MRAHAWFAVSAAFALAAAPAPVQGVTISGTVTSREEGRPLARAVVRALDPELRAETDEGGFFTLRNVSPGRHPLSIALVGYRPLLDTLTVSSTDTLLQVHYELEAVAFVLREIVVRASTPESESRNEVVSKAEVERTPATFDDLLRAVQLSPGLAAPDFSASSLIRGGESDETLVRLNGVDLLEPYHIPDWGGALSVVNLDAVEQARFLKGGLPARYGRHLSGALEIDTPSAHPDRMGLSLGLGLSQLRAIVDGPLGPDAAVRLGVRHGLIAAAYRTYAFDPNTEVEPDFQDVVAEVRFGAAGRNEVRLLGLASRDHLHYSESFDENDIEGDRRNVTVGATWTRRHSDRMQTTFMASADHFDRSQVLGRTGLDENLTRAFRSRLEALWSAAPDHTAEVGVLAEWEDATLRFDVPDGAIQGGVYVEEIVRRVEGDAARRRAEGYATLHSRWGPRLSTSFGCNVSDDNYVWNVAEDGFELPSVPGEVLVSPRASAAYRVSSSVRIQAAAGVLRQPAFLNALRPDRIPDPLGRKRQAREVLAGVGWKRHGLEVRVDGYVRSELGVGFPVQDLDARPDLEDLDRGSSRGLEFTVHGPSWPLLDLHGAYAWSRAEWEVSSGNVPRSYDQRHAVTTSVNVRPIGRLNVNATARYHTGNAYTESFWTSPDGRYNWSEQSGPFMGGRYPHYFRLDLRILHPLGIGRPGGNVYLDWINLTDRENVYVYTVEFEPLPGGGSAPGRRSIELFPRVPYLGLELKF